MRYADEIVALACISLKLFYMLTKEVADILGWLSEGLSHGRVGLFATFDQSRMGQVGDLIQAMEKLNLNV